MSEDVKEVVKEEVSRGTLQAGETHPSAYTAMRYIRSLGIGKLFEVQEAFSSCAIEGNRLGEICSETLRRIMNGEPVSDRYAMGLAWALWDMEEMAEEEKSKADAKAKRLKARTNKKKGK